MVHRYLVKGRVQGVGFRWFVHSHAARIGLRGWVRNTEDGHVEAVAAGSPAQIEELVLMLHKGSRGSRVDVVEVHELPESEAAELHTFKIEGAW